MAKSKTTTKSKTQRVSLNINEAKDFLRHIINNNRYLQDNNKPPVAVEIVGDQRVAVLRLLAHDELLNDLFRMPQPVRVHVFGEHGG